MNEVDFRLLGVDQLPLPKRAINCMKNNGVFTLAQLINTPVSDMQIWRNMGKGSIEKVEDFIGTLDRNEFKKIAGENRIENYEKSLFLNSVYPISCVEEIKVLFNYKDCLYENLKVEQTDLPCRIVSFLKDNNIETVNELLMVPNCLFKEKGKVGAITLEDTRKWFRNHTEIIVSESKIKLFNYGMDCIAKYFGGCDSYRDSFFMAAVRKNYYDLISSDYIDIKDETTGEFNESFYSQIFECENVYKCKEEDILIILRGRNWTSKDYLSSKIPYFKNSKRIDIFLDSLVKNKKIERQDDAYRINYPSVYDWVNTLPAKKQDILKARLKGDTLEDIGVCIGVTRERVRQIINKEFKKAPFFKEDFNRFWYEEYNFTLDEMVSIIGVSEQDYIYYSIVGEKGKKSIEYLLDDKRKTTKILKAYYKYIYSDSVYIEGEWVLKNRTELVQKYLELKCTAPQSYEELIEGYYDFLKEYDLDDSFRYSNSRTFYNYVDRYTSVLKGRDGVRFYPIKDYELSDFILDLHLERFNDVVISTLKLFRENKILMDEYDIRDDYELHNVLRKYNTFYENIENKYDLKIGRIPNLYFGNADIENQLVDYIKHNYPIKVNDFADLIEEEYGLNKNTILINYSQNLSRYIHNGEYRDDIGNVLSISERLYFAAYLKDDFYYLQDLQNDYEKQFPGRNINRIERYTWKQLGYISYSQYIVRLEYDSAYDYFKTVCLEKDFLDLSMLNSRITSLSYFNIILYDLLANLDLLEYDYHKFVKTDKFLLSTNIENGLIIKDFIDKVVEYSKGYKFFTLNQLIMSGFNHELYNCNINHEYFYNSLLRNSRKLFYIRSGESCIFSHENKDISFVGFLKWYIKDIRKIRLYDLINNIEDEYGLVLRSDLVISKIRNSSMYYDSDMEKIYLTKNDYYNDL